MRLMTTSVIPFFALFAALLVPTAGLAGAPSGVPVQTTTMTVESIAWISGNWELADGPVTIDERWSPVAGGTMFGTSRTVSGGRTVFFEFIRIETRPDGVFYVAQPKGRHPGVDFKLVRASEAEAVFENLKHDFPKRIIYRKGADGSLTARIEGDGTEKEKPQDFRYKAARQ